MELSPAVRAVCERRGAAVDLIMDRIYGFLDASPRWTLTMAALCGHLRLAQRLSARRPRAFDHCCTEAMDAAAEFGHLAVVQWLHTNRAEGCTKDAMNMAAANGHLDVVQWLHAHRAEGCSKAAMDFAAQNGHLRVVEWLHAHRKEGCTRLAMDNAAKDGHLRVVQWLHAHREEGCSRSAFENACANGHEDVSHWLLAHRPRNCCVARALEKAAAYNQRAMVEWLHARPWDSDHEDADDEGEQEDAWDEWGDDHEDPFYADELRLWLAGDNVPVLSTAAAERQVILVGEDAYY